MSEANNREPTATAEPVTLTSPSATGLPDQVPGFVNSAYRSVASTVDAAYRALPTVGMVKSYIPGFAQGPTESGASGDGAQPGAVPEPVPAPGAGAEGDGDGAVGGSDAVGEDSAAAEVEAGAAVEAEAAAVDTLVVETPTVEPAEAAPAPTEEGAPPAHQSAGLEQPSSTTSPDESTNIKQDPVPVEPQSEPPAASSSEASRPVNLDVGGGGGGEGEEAGTGSEAASDAQSALSGEDGSPCPKKKEKLMARVAGLREKVKDKLHH